MPGDGREPHGAQRPLSGVKVLDLSRLLPGPFASLVLGDLGAQVDKIEDTEAGDYLRVMPPMRGDTSAMFLALNRNKRSACLDLKSDAGRETLLQLVESYDVLLEQFRPGVLDRLGVGHATLLARNPRLVVCALTGYGQTGPSPTGPGTISITWRGPGSSACTDRPTGRRRCQASSSPTSAEGSGA